MWFLKPSMSSSNLIKVFCVRPGMRRLQMLSSQQQFTVHIVPTLETLTAARVSYNRRRGVCWGDSHPPYFGSYSPEAAPETRSHAPDLSRWCAPTEWGKQGGEGRMPGKGSTSGKTQGAASAPSHGQTLDYEFHCRSLSTTARWLGFHSFPPVSQRSEATGGRNSQKLPSEVAQGVL